jgi:hypothetical protein
MMKKEEKKSYLYEAKKQYIKQLKGHKVCSREICCPENESALKTKGLIRSNDYKTNDLLFLCNYGKFHECTKKRCLEGQICPISGLGDLPVIEKDNFFINENSKRARPTETDIIYQEAETLIEKLLYSDEREKINKQWKQHQQKLCNKEKNNAVDNDFPVNLIQLAMIESKYNKKELPLEILEYDPHRIAGYAQLALRLYENVSHYVVDRMCIESLTLALLYKMKSGLKIDGITIIPIDLFLLENLPLMNDLPKFGINKKHFTKGEKAIDAAINQAVKQSVPLTEFALHEVKIDPIVVFKPVSRKCIKL